ncbi:MAG: AraC family transcriptional regulator [Chloroflexota bacterium]
MSSPSIERYFDQACHIPALRAIGQSRQAAAREGLAPHFEPYFEIHLVMHGVVDWWVENETYTLRPGAVYITKPHEQHGGVGNVVQPCSLTWLQIDPAYLPIEGEQIEAELLDLKERTWIGAHELIDYVDAMLVECRHPKADSGRLVSGYLQLFLARFLRQYQNRSIQPIPPSHYETLKSILDQALLEGATVSIQTLCDETGLSRSRIFQLFEQHAGQSPIAYLNSRRIEIAKRRLIETDAPITDIALELGYSSSQHFATSFKRTTGRTPRGYRKRRVAQLMGAEK